MRKNQGKGIIETSYVKDIYHTETNKDYSKCSSYSIPYFLVEVD